VGEALSDGRASKAFLPSYLSQEAAQEKRKIRTKETDLQNLGEGRREFSG
jgi:hypothetical protein